MADPVLRVDGCAKRYGETTALGGVSMVVERGETVALVGPNGAGKTTLVRCCTGTLNPDDGGVSLFGAPPEAVDRSRIGLLPQAFDPPGRLSPRELVRYYAGLYGDAMPVAAALDAVDLGTGARDTRYEDCSGGQRRRTCVACALVNEPELLVLDEPTTGIDPAGRRSVRGRLDALADAGTTVLLTTHDMGEADRLADRVVVLADGCVAEAGTPAEIVGEHGGPPRIVVGLAAGGRDVVRRARDAVADAVGVAPTVEDDRLRVEGVDATAVGAVVDALDAAGVGYTAAGWAAPTLEDAYLSLVDARRDPGDGEAAVAA